MTPQTKIPTHVAIIMDGNGRWAEARGKERGFGHLQGVESVRACIEAARQSGVRYITFYTFSTENWGRPTDEVSGLMELLCQSVVNETPELKKQVVRMLIIGSREGLSDKVNQHLAHIERETAEGKELTAILAINYSSRSEIARAAKSLASQAAAGVVAPADITEASISENLYTHAIPDPDLLIRTGGEQRLSNFLLWQAAYAELYFTPTMWPDFGKESFAEALATFGQRERRFGLTKEQI
ncbi:MAG: di-trans,poly-cis-decaprenylcistransferase [Rikenellaceae bacterium]|jgi:undecaprenyl diphosphate synthase|nr:di-trans,poly-cis-decaprenylcistransferase [Rikenellaceae bacterium]